MDIDIIKICDRNGINMVQSNIISKLKCVKDEREQSKNDVRKNEETCTASRHSGTMGVREKTLLLKVTAEAESAGETRAQSWNVQGTFREEVEDTYQFGRAQKNARSWKRQVDGGKNGNEE